MTTPLSPEKQLSPEERTELREWVESLGPFTIGRSYEWDEPGNRYEITTIADRDRMPVGDPSTIVPALNAIIQLLNDLEAVEIDRNSYQKCFGDAALQLDVANKRLAHAEAEILRLQR